ncbi:MAG: SseB family protein [Phycisphaera sp.]|nr:MAG: SseB family protein [Phycisphaera sp.]
MSGSEQSGGPGSAGEGRGEVNDARLQELIDALVEDPKNEAAEREFWHLFCNLPAWILLTTAEDARKAVEEGRPEIQVQMFQQGDRSFLPLFSSNARAQGVLEGQAFATISMPPEKALGYVCGFRGRIEGFIVNPMPGKAGGFGHRLPDLCAFFQHERGFLPAGAIHCAVDHVRNTNHPAAFEMVHGLVAGLDKVYVAIKDESFAFVRDGDNLWLWAFTDAAMAVRQCNEHEGLKMIEATPAQLAERMGEAMSQSEGRIKGAVVNHPENSIALDQALLLRAIEGKGE